MPIDPYKGYLATPAGPAISIAQVAPSDTGDLGRVTVGLNVGTPGYVRVTMKDGTEGTLYIAPGGIMPLRVTRVWNTGTTATGISALF